ncbi:MAG: hypothetical protein KIG53_03015 [Oscillospiraceae bacterium]|nr:hypothetical protein [Oscillospiraceae bacterium]
MYEPRLYDLPRTSELINTFSGYNNNAVIRENEFSFQENISSNMYPLLAPRNKRAYFNVCGDALEGVFSKSKICYINNGLLYYGGEAVDGVFFPEIPEKRKFVSMGAKLLIFPDKIYVNTADFTDYGSLEAEFITGDGTETTVSLCKSNGELYENYSISSTEPENAQNGDLWLDTSVTPNVLKQYSGSLGMWIEFAATYVRISSAGIGKNFEIEDGVEITGLSEEDLNGIHIIKDKGDDYITVAGLISNTSTQNTSVTVSRKLPDMDFVCESGNRLWGCNKNVNEIYASKLGDPTNFNVFQGVSTDSYAVTVGSDGEFTGITTFRGYIMFFKENCVHKVYGSYPPYTVNTSYLRGVQKGSSESLVCLNETLYYKSPNCICAYEGGVPVSVSDSLGTEYYSDAVAGSLGDKYYICMSDKNGKRHLFSFDENKALWCREDCLDICSFANHNSNLYFIANINGVKRLGLIDGENALGNFSGELSGYFFEDDVSWEAVSGLWGLGLPENKYYSALSIRLALEKGASVSVYFQFDSEDKWHKQLTVNAEKTGSHTLPFTTPRCDHLKIKLKGKGKCKIFSISRKTETGSELNV